MNEFFNVDDLKLSDRQKADVLEWFARKAWVILEETSCDPDYYGKSYDPLVIDLDEKEAYSYVFNLGTGGRTHPFESLQDIESSLLAEIINIIKSRG